MKRGVAFQFFGLNFGPKPEGWEDFVLIRCDTEPARMELFGRDWLGNNKSVAVEPLTATEIEQLDEGYLRYGVTAKIAAAFAEFKPLDALDIWRATQ